MRNPARSAALPFRLFVNEIKRTDHDSLIEAQSAARDLWVE